MVCRGITLLLLALALIACGSGNARLDHSEARSANPGLPRGGETRPRAAVGLQGVQPYRSDGPYAEQLRPCVLAERESQSCSFAQLPLIGMEHAYPSVDDIMDRVLVSHQWMGKRFEEMLYALPADVRVLMRSVTAIVLAEDVRPSYYWSLTGAVYVDGYHLWLDSDEKSTFANLLIDDALISANDQLPFYAWWRYVKEDDFAYRIWGDLDADVRGTEQALLPLAATLFHELAHANDYFPASQIPSINASWTVVEARSHVEASRVSEALYQSAPLVSPLMHRVAGAIHLNKKLVGDDATLTAEDVGLAFQMGLANDDYAYISRFEDVAMLFEETMMMRHFGVSRDVAYLTRPLDEAAAGCDDYAVAWGMRSRIAADGIKQRALQVAQQIMPSRQWQVFFDELSPAQFLSFGSGWCQSLVVGNDAAAAAEPAHRRLSERGFTQRRLTRPSVPEH